MISCCDQPRGNFLPRSSTTRTQRLSSTACQELEFCFFVTRIFDKLKLKINLRPTSRRRDNSREMSGWFVLCLRNITRAACVELIDIAPLPLRKKIQFCNFVLSSLYCFCTNHRVSGKIVSASCDRSECVLLVRLLWVPREKSLQLGVDVEWR